MNKFIYHLYLFIPCCALLLFATSGKWPAGLIEGLCFTLLLLHLLHRRREGSSLYRAPGLVPLLLLAGYVLLQMVPLPPLLLRLLSAQTWDLYAESVWLVRPAAWMPLSVAPKATLSGFFALTAGIAYYLMSLQILAERERLQEAMSVLAVFAGLFSLLGLGMFFFSEGSFFWPFGTWNSEAIPPAAARSRYAALAAMMLPLVLAQYLASRPQVSYNSLRERIIDFCRSPRENAHVLLGFFLIPLACSLLLSFSGVELASGLAALLVFTGLLLLRGRSARGTVFNSLTPVAVLLVLALLAGGLFWGRADTGEGAFPAQKTRQLLWHDSSRIVGDFPLLGTGLGSFAHVYPRYRSSLMPQPSPEQSGNDSLQLVVEVGLLGTVLGGWFLLSLLRQSYSFWRTRHNRSSVYLTAAAFAGLSAALLQTAVGALPTGVFGCYFFFSGLLFAAAACRNRGKEAQRGGLARIATTRVMTVAAALLLTVGLAFHAGIVLAQKEAAPTGAETTAAVSPETALEEKALRQAMRLDPLEGAYRYQLADVLLAVDPGDETMEAFWSALRRDPLNAEYLQRLGLVMDNLGVRERAEKLLRAGIVNDRANPQRHKTFAFWLLAEGRSQEGLDYIRQAIYWGPEQTGDILAMMALSGLEDEQMQRILPERAFPLLAFGDYLLGIGKEEAAEESYRAAVAAARQEPWPTPGLFLQAAEFFTGRSRYNDALDAVLAGIDMFPGNPRFRFLAANLYEKMGIEYRAVEEYRGTLALDPGNAEARSSLQRLVGREK